MSSAGQLFIEVLQDLICIGGDGPQIAILRAGIDINNRLHVVMVHRGSPNRGRDLHQISHQLWTLLRDHRNIH